MFLPSSDTSQSLSFRPTACIGDLSGATPLSLVLTKLYRMRYMLARSIGDLRRKYAHFIQFVCHPARADHSMYIGKHELVTMCLHLRAYECRLYQCTVVQSISPLCLPHLPTLSLDINASSEVPTLQKTNVHSIAHVACYVVLPFHQRKCSTSIPMTATPLRQEEGPTERYVLCF